MSKNDIIYMNYIGGIYMNFNGNINKKKYIGIIVILAIVLTSIIGFNIFKSDKGDENPELLVAQKYEQVKAGDEAIDGTEFVTFDAFYLRDLDGDGYAEKIRGTCKEIGTQDTLYMDLNVLTNGTLKDAKITINGKNFYFATALVKDSIISQDYISTNLREIKLNDVNNGTQKLIFGMVQSGDYSYSGGIAKAIGNNTSKYTITDNSITLTGTHVADDGTETPISKTVYLTNDWYGTTKAEIYMPYWLKDQEYDIATALDEENQKLNITFKFNPREKDNKLIIYKNHIEGELPLINGYAPTNVTVSNQNTVVTYDKETRIFTAEMLAKTNDASVVTTTVSRDITYEINVEYPIDAYKTLGADAIAINIPLKAYYEGYNNTNKEFENPYKSNIAEDVISVVYKNPDGENARVDVYVGRYIWDEESKTHRYVVSKELPINIYNQVETETSKVDEYIVQWYAYTGDEALNVPLILKETPENYTDQFVDVNGNYSSMNKYIANTGIYFTNANVLLGEEGYIKVYNDETNELLHTFTKDDWSKYTLNNPYKYETPVKHIRVETSNIAKNTYLYVYNVKEIDDVLLTAEYTREKFDNLGKIYSYVTGYMNIDGTETKLANDINFANYEMPYSVATISINPSYVSNQETKKGVKLNIVTNTTRYNTKKWQNGEFLIKYPNEIIDVNINSVTSEDKDIIITGVDTYEENGNIYTKIYTSNDIEKTVELVIDADLTADPRKATATRNVELYYYNHACSNYDQDERTKDVFDINGNENVEEYIGYTTASLNIIAPSNLLTSQIATDFDDVGSIVVAPQEATIDKVDGTKTAKVNINITNNYSNTISEVKIVGKIPFEGNTYQLNGTDLGSTFSTTMTQEGIVVPEELKEYTTIYYSYSEEVTDDINAKKNGWTTTPEDMSQVKSYLIDLGDYVMPVDNTKTFNYTIQIPSGLDYNEVSYSAHAVYYYLDTDQGKLKTQTEPNKLGFRIAEKYDLEITKYEINSTKVVPGVVFSVQEVGVEDAKTAATYSSGIATIKNLYVEREYIVKEIKTNSNYILDATEIRVIGHIVDGELQLEILEGGFKTTPVIEVIENANIKVKTSLENEVKYNFVLNKTQTGTNDVIQGIRFELTDYNGKVKRYTTNNNGQLNIKLLEPNKQYTLTETESQGHYLKDAVTFMMVRDENNNLKFNVLAGDLDTLPVIDQRGDVPVVTAGLQNEKIPTYSLRITKKETETETTIAGAQFKLIGENKADNVLYTTDGNGVIQIDNLYQYVEGKNVTGEYSLQEIYPTEGYILNDTPIVFKATKDATDNLILEITSGTIREAIEDVVVDNTNPDNPIINITIDNDPVFTLTKVDAETGEPLEGVEFEITDLDGNVVVDANGNIIDKVYTDSNGKIRLSLTEGLYKATETKPLEGYKIPDVYTGIGIGKSKKSVIGLEYKEDIIRKDFNYTTCMVGFSEHMIVGMSNNLKAIDYEGNLLWRKEYQGKSYVELVKIQNQEFAIGFGTIGDYNYFIQKIDENGNVYWEVKQTMKYTDYVISDKDITFFCKDGRIIKYDFDGNITMDIICENYAFSKACKYKDGYAAITSDKQIVLLNSQGEMLSYNDLSVQVTQGEVYNNQLTYINNQFYFAQGNNTFLLNENGEFIKKISTGYKTILENDGDVIAFSNDKIDCYNYEITTKHYSLIRDTYTNGHNDGPEYVLKDNMLYMVYDDGIFIKVSLVDREIQSNKKVFSFSPLKIFEQNDEYIVVTQLGNIIRYDKEFNEINQIIDIDEYIDSVDFDENKKIFLMTTPYSDKRLKIYNLETDTLYEFNVGNFSTNTNVAIGENILYVWTFSGNKIKAYDLEGNVLWENTVSSSINGIISVDDGCIVCFSSGLIIKYDINGNIEFQLSDPNKAYRDLCKVEDGFYILAYRGIVDKYDFSGNLISSINLENGRNYIHMEVSDNFICVIDNLDNVNTYDFNGNITSLTKINNLNDCKNIKIIDNGAIVVDSDGSFTMFYNSIVEPEIPTSQNVVVENVIAKYQITTEVDGIGGNIYGEGQLPYEEVKYKENSEKEIVITPLIGFKVQSIKINGKSIDYVENPDGTVNIEKFTSITEDKEVVVSFIKSNESLIIEKKDSTNDKPLANARFNIKQLETRTEPIIEQIAGEIVGNGNKYSEADVNNKVENQLGALTNNNDKYYFIENGSGGYESNNQTIANSTASSYIKIDLKNYTGKYAVVVNASISSQNYSDYGYAIVTTSTDVPSRYDSKRFIYISGTQNAKNYTTIIDGGNEYYLHLGYYKNNSTDTGEDKFIINSLNVYNTITNSYEFIDDGNGGYESNNQEKSSTTANSYIPIDLTNYKGQYNLIINASISSQYSDYGYATISESKNAPTYDSSLGRFIYISGTQTAKDYTTILEGGKIYYLHLGYYKNDSTDSGEDKFTINSINLTLNTDDFIDEDIITNSDGEAIIKLPRDWKYQITEVEAPEGYTLNLTPIIYDFVSGQENILTVENDPQVDIIVHHYIKNTTTSVAPDEIQKGDLGKEYTTSPKIDLIEYQLVKNEDGTYQIPENASGVYTEKTQVITYYYEVAPVQLLVHHYLDGTEDSIASDEISEAQKESAYTTSPVEYPILDEKYELVTTKLPENASGTLEESVTEVTYYYKIKEHKITTEVDGIGGTITGEGQTPYETVLHGNNSINDIIVTPNYGYEIESITINGVEQNLEDYTIWEDEYDNLLAKFENVIEDKHIVVKFKIKNMSIGICKAWEDDNNMNGKRPDSITVEIYNGNTKLEKTSLDKTMGAEPQSIEDNHMSMWIKEIQIPMIDEQGNLVNWDELSFTEVEINSNDLEFYTTSIEKGGFDELGPIGYVYITNTFEIPDRKIDIEVTKNWSDNNNANLRRPSQIKLQVKNGDTVVQEQVIDVTTENTQTYTFTDLPEYDENGNTIKYTIDEVEVNANDLKFYTKVINNETYTITNTFTIPEDKVSVDVTKKWEDNSNANNVRPSQITLQVKNGDDVIQEQIVDVTADNEKVYTFENLAKYDANGQEIVYTADEKEVEGYTKITDRTIVTNTIKSYKITTEVNGEGGDISGQYENPYEEVTYGGTNIKDIVITPSEGYEISKITINDVEQTLPTDSTVPYTIDKFENVTEDKHVIVEFKKREYKITTEVDGEGGIISGQEDNPYEIVVHGENSVKDIIVTPDLGYQIESITVNGQAIEFTPAEDGTYTLDKFISMTEDKHVVVKFERKDTSIIVKHQTEDGTDLVEPETVNGKIGDEYTTTEKEFADYDIKTIPDNANGTMTDEQIEVIYVYSQVKGKITVTKVDISDTNTKLSGATFKLEKLDDSENVDTTFTAQEKTTESTGIVEFTDLLVGKYQVTETKAPQGYELNTEVTEVEVTKANRELNVTVKNREKLTLPETGEINYTIVISGIGLAVMLVAVLIKKFKGTKVN